MRNRLREIVRGNMAGTEKTGSHRKESYHSNYLTMSNEQNTPNFYCNNKGRHITDPGYKPVCKTQCAECAEIYPAQQDMAKPHNKQLNVALAEKKEPAIDEIDAERLFEEHNNIIQSGPYDDEVPALEKGQFIKAYKQGIAVLREELERLKQNADILNWSYEGALKELALYKERAKNNQVLYETSDDLRKEAERELGRQRDMNKEAEKKFHDLQNELHEVEATKEAMPKSNHTNNLNSKPMAQNKHEELVRQIAEEMYHASFPDMNPQHWELIEFEKSAHIAVKRMAEEVKVLGNKVFFPGMLNRILEERGLIPDDKNGTE